MSTKPKAKWVDIGALDSIPVEAARLVKSDAGCIAVFRTSATEAYAISNSCPHKQGPLAQGIIAGKFVTCPLHNWVISLETGKAQGADVGHVATYPLKIEKGRILLDVSSLKVAEKV
jgi:nitrite reductase (NADH) small subunit